MPAITSFETSCVRGELEHVRSHHEVRVPVAAGVRAVGADPADLGGQVEDELRLGVGEEPLRLVETRQVVVGAASDEGLDRVLAEPVDEVRPEEASTAGDEDVHRVGSVAFPSGSQSTRPIQRSRLAAYHSIVRATPSSQETCGSQPVSRFSFS